MPNGCSDDILPWARNADNPLDTKFPYGNAGLLTFVPFFVSLILIGEGCGSYIKDIPTLVMLFSFGVKLYISSCSE